MPCCCVINIKRSQEFIGNGDNNDLVPTIVCFCGTLWGYDIKKPVHLPIDKCIFHTRVAPIQNQASQTSMKITADFAILC